jgi:hypothetical protein
VFPSLQGLAQLCGVLYYNVVRTLPALVRSWSSDVDKKTLLLVEKFTIQFISPALVQYEVENIIQYAIKTKQKPTDDFQIKGNKSTAQVTAIYVKDDVNLSSKKIFVEWKLMVFLVVLSIPPTYPLKGVTVEEGKKAGVHESLWRKWLLSIHTLMLTQDGSVLDAVLLWKSNLDKHFDGVEVCPICYSLFHTSNHSLPNLACKTCKNKFHSACMYKWIKVSHKNDCPLCKTPFN